MRIPGLPVNEHRKLEAGGSNPVVQPQDWDERGKGVKVLIRLIGPVTGGGRGEKADGGDPGGGASAQDPDGGALSFEVLRREVGDRSRFNNRRQGNA